MHRWTAGALLLRATVPQATVPQAIVPQATVPLAAVLLAIVLGAAGCSGTTSSGKGVDVVYGVVGNACSTDITYQDLGDQPTLVTQQTLPWHFDFTIPSSKVNGFGLSLSAVTSCPTGTITTNIVVNGALYATASGSTPAIPVGVGTTLF